MKYCEPHLRDIIARQQPDVIVEDNVVVFPALTTSDAPFVRVVSCNPLEMKGPGVAPTFSGLPADDDSEWSAFRAEYERTHRAMWSDFNDFVVSGDVLGRTRHQYIVSKGPQHTEYELADNMWGADFSPQTTLMPLVDLVITHGGNNTTTEALHFGKPMVLLPLFWDQYDSAQRMDELGFGRRLRTYAFTDDELAGAVDELLADTELRSRMDTTGAAIRGRRGAEQAADVIEQVAQRHRART